MALIAFFVFEEPDVDHLFWIAREKVLLQPAHGPLDGISRTTPNRRGLFVTENDKRLLQHDGKACWSAFPQLLKMRGKVGVVLSRACGEQRRGSKRCEEADAKDAQPPNHGSKAINQLAGGPGGPLPQTSPAGFSCGRKQSRMAAAAGR